MSLKGSDPDASDTPKWLQEHEATAASLITLILVVPIMLSLPSLRDWIATVPLSMDSSFWGAAGQWASAAATVVSLVFLYRQVKQSTETMSLSIRQMEEARQKADRDRQDAFYAHVVVESFKPEKPTRDLCYRLTNVGTGPAFSIRIAVSVPCSQRESVRIIPAIRSGDSVDIRLSPPTDDSDMTIHWNDRFRNTGRDRCEIRLIQGDEWITVRETADGYEIV